VNDDELRVLVREAIARHAPGAGATASPASSSQARSFPADHASHFRYHLVNDTDACVIEPTVLCNHCGYCKSHGH
jgi:hypothetical protein